VPGSDEVFLVKIQARGDGTVYVKPWDLRGGSRVPPASLQQLEGGVQCQPSIAPLPLTARLQREAMRVGRLSELLSAIMVQLSKCFVVQHDASSFPMSRGDRAGLSTRVQQRSCSPSLPFHVELRVRETRGLWL
jgi:hypothetical protein